MTKNIFTFASLVLLSACQTTPPISNERQVQTAEEVANVFVSAYPAIPWTDIASQLEPKHSLSTADARSMAAIATQGQTNQFLSSFAAGLGIGLQSKSFSSSSTTTETGTVTSTTKKVDPGPIPSSSGALPLALTESSLAPGASPTGLGVDAATQLMQGTAVFQLAAILDNQLSKALKLKGYEAYLITFQVNVQPLARNLPYDAYINLTLMPSSWDLAVADSPNAAKAAFFPSVVMYPLVIADALESSNVSSSIETMTQAAMAISGLVGNAGINMGVGSASDKLAAVVGSDKNSLVTLGRVSDNTLRIRLGAQYQGSRTLALVPRTQNISVVAFVQTGNDPSRFVENLSAVAKVEFLDAKTGEKMPAALKTYEAQKEIKLKIVSVLNENGYEFDYLPSVCKGDPELPLTILRALDHGDYTIFSQCVKQSPFKPTALARATTAWKKLFSQPDNDEKDDVPVADSIAQQRSSQNLFALSNKVKSEIKGNLSQLNLQGLGITRNFVEASNNMTVLEQDRLRNMVASLLALRIPSAESRLTIALRPYPKRRILPPGEQLLLFSDDKNALSVLLREGENQKKEYLTARLLINQDGKQFALLPTTLVTNADGDTITVTFPSIIGNKLMTKNPNPKSGEANELLPEPIELRVVSSLDGLDRMETIYKNTRIIIAEEKPVPNPVRINSNLLVPDKDGMAKLIININKWSGPGKSKLSLQISGAEIVGSEPKVAFDPTVNAIPIVPESSVVLTLGNLSPTQLVQIKTLADGKPLAGSYTLSVDTWRNYRGE